MGASERISGSTAPESPRYDGFISYSHAADDLLAPRLQAGLQRFAKPWWRRRAVRIFRDESSLAANPHLWSSITDALDDSSWFVLLLSEDAASSEWVGKEIEHWIDHKPSDRILPVVTDGTFGWENGDVTGTAIPHALHGVFGGEPRWVDLRFARDEDDLDLRNPDFSSVVADLASAIRGVPKDELESEEVRQHRRAIRTAWAAGAALIMLTVAAVGASVFALDQRNDARRQAQFARANELLAHSTAVLESDPELGTLLALSSIELFERSGESPGAAVTALRAANVRNRVVARLPGGRFVDTHGGLVATAADDGVAIWDLSTGDVVETHAAAGGVANGVAFSPDGNLLAVSYVGRTPPVTITNRTTGATFDVGGLELFPDVFANPLNFDPTGAYLAIDSFLAGFEVWSVTDRTLVVAVADGAYAGFTPDGLLSYTTPDGTVTAHAMQSLEPIYTFTVELSDFGHWASWSPDSSAVAVATSRSEVQVLDPNDGAAISSSTHERVWRPVWLTGGDSFLIGGESGLRVVDARNGEVIRAFAEEGGSASFEYRLMDTGLVTSAGFGGQTVVFDPSSVGGVELAGWAASIGEPETLSYLAAGDRLLLSSAGEYVVADARTGMGAIDPVAVDSTGPSPFTDASGTLVASGDPTGVWTIRDVASGDVVLTAPPGSTVLGIDSVGERAVVAHDGECSGAGSAQLIQLSGSPVTELGCWQMAVFSADGSHLALTDGAGSAQIVDGSSGSSVTTLALASYDPGLESWVVADFTPEGDRLILGDAAGTVHVLSTEVLRDEGEPEEAVVEILPAHNNLILHVQVSPDGSVLATSAVNEPLRLWSLSANELLWEMESVADFAFHPTSPELAVLTDTGSVRIHTLDTDQLVELAGSRMQRSYTSEECRFYRIDPCPTLDEIKTGRDRPGQGSRAAPIPAT